MTNSAVKTEDKDWFTIDNVDQLDSPALVFYPDRIAENIALLKNSIDDIDRLRPHVKTHKSAAVSLLMLEAGISKFKCATIAEAEMLGSCLAPDVLLAYQPVGPKVARFIALINKFPATLFSCLVDNQTSLQELSVAAEEAGIKIPVYLDLNVGMNRTGIPPGVQALDLYKRLLLTSGLRLMGIHAYDGHIHDAEIERRKSQWQAVWDDILAFKKSITDLHLPEPVIVAGGTPTYPFYAAQQQIECSPGTFILWDKGYQDAFTEQNYLTSALVISRVISLTGINKITVDLGHKAVAAENELAKRVFFLNAPNAIMIGQSEEHLVIELNVDHGFAIGDVLYGLPIHICPTVALHAYANTIYSHHFTDEWKITSRDRKITI